MNAYEDRMAARLRAVEDKIAQWKAKMAWPGRAPEPPFALWEERRELRKIIRANRSI
jgi:hypothetical protein